MVLALHCSSTIQGWNDYLQGNECDSTIDGCCDAKGLDGELHGLELSVRCLSPLKAIAVGGFAPPNPLRRISLVLVA